MRTNSISLFTIFVLSLFLGLADRAASQEHSAEARLQELAKQLNLSDDQKQKLMPVLQEEAQRIQTVRNNTSLTQRERWDKVRKIHSSYEPKINAILTPAQQGQLKQIKQQAREKKQDERAQN